MDAADLHNRFAYHPATEHTAPVYDELRTLFEAVAHRVDSLAPDSREKSLAVTALEDSLMWTCKAVAMTTPVDDTNAATARVLPDDTYAGRCICTPGQSPSVQCAVHGIGAAR